MYNDTLVHTCKGSSIGEACSSGRGQGQRKAEKICVSKGFVFNWEKSKFGTCKYEKLKTNVYKATWEIKFTCTEKD
jgi:hypothetical protein